MFKRLRLDRPFVKFPGSGKDMALVDGEKEKALQSFGFPMGASGEPKSTGMKPMESESGISKSNVIWIEYNGQIGRPKKTVRYLR
jgi:hypothetical protein